MTRLTSLELLAGLFLATALAVGDANAAPPPSREAAMKPFEREMGWTDDQTPMIERYFTKAYQDCDYGSSSEGLRMCDGEEIERQDRRMNLAYRRRMSLLSIGRRQALRNDQRAWLKRRRWFCDLAMDPEGGNSELLVLNSCWLRSTVARTLFIEAFR